MFRVSLKIVWTKRKAFRTWIFHFGNFVTYLIAWYKEGRNLHRAFRHFTNISEDGKCQNACRGRRNEKTGRAVARKQREKEKAGTEHGKFETSQTLCRILRAFKQTSLVLRILSVIVTLVARSRMKRKKEEKPRASNGERSSLAILIAVIRTSDETCTIDSKRLRR